MSSPNAPEFVYEVLQRVQVRGLLFTYVLVCIDASGHTTAMKREFARELIEAHARAPAFNSAFREGVERRTHPADDRTELLVFFLS